VKSSFHSGMISRNQPTVLCFHRFAFKFETYFVSPWTLYFLCWAITSKVAYVFCFAGLGVFQFYPGFLVSQTKWLCVINPLSVWEKNTIPVLPSVVLFLMPCLTVVSTGESCWRGWELCYDCAAW